MSVCAPAWLLGLVAALLAGPQAVREVSRRRAVRSWLRSEEERDREGPGSS